MHDATGERAESRRVAGAGRAAVLAAVVIALVAAAGVLQSGSDPAGRAEDVTDSADHFWARAVLHSLPHDEVDFGRVVALYAEAISRSDSPARIHVALGDFLRGPVPVAARFEAALSDVEQANDEGNGVPAGFSSCEIAESAAEGIRTILRGDDQAVAAYLAAIRADPGNRLAHYRLAVYGEGGVARRSVRWLIRNDPGNALGWWLNAAAAVDADPDAVLPLLQRAISRPRFVVYDDPVPVPAGSLYPQVYGEFAGHPVPASALRFLVYRQNAWNSWADPLVDSLAGVLYHVAGIAGNPDDPRSLSAISVHHTACCQLAFNASGNMPVALKAVAHSGESFRLARERLTGNSTARAALVEEHRAIERFRNLVRSELVPWYDQMSGLKPDVVFAGRVDPVAGEIEMCRRMRSLAIGP